MTEFDKTFLKQMIKDNPNITIVEPYKEDKITNFINILKEAVAIDYIGEPFIRIIDDKIYLYIHTLPSCNDSPYDCYQLFKCFSVMNLNEVLL